MSETAQDEVARLGAAVLGCSRKPSLGRQYQATKLYLMMAMDEVRSGEDYDE